jgi:hypothetical protein
MQPSVVAKFQGAGCDEYVEESVRCFNLRHGVAAVCMRWWRRFAGIAAAVGYPFANGFSFTAAISSAESNAFRFSFPVPRPDRTSGGHVAHVSRCCNADHRD